MIWWHWTLIGLVVGFFVGFVTSYYQEQLRVKLWLEHEAKISEESRRLGIRVRVRPTATLDQLHAKLVDLQSRMPAAEGQQAAYQPEPEGEVVG